MTSAQAATPITDGLYFELIADDIAGAMNGDAITSWTDTVSGNVLAGNATYNSNFANGHASLTFTNAQLMEDATLEGSIPSTENMTMFLVGTTLTTATNGQQSYFFGQRVGNDRFRVTKNTNQTTYAARVGGGAGFTTGSGVTLDTLEVFSLRSGGNAVQFNRNGTEIGTGGNGAGIALGRVQLANGLNADIAEVLIYDRALTDVEVGEVEAYLTAKYVPEPSTGALLGFAGLALILRRRK